MIKPKFIMNNYVCGNLVKLPHRGGNATCFRRGSSLYAIVRETNYIYGKLGNGNPIMLMENDGYSTFRSDEALYELHGDGATFIKYLTKTHPSRRNDCGFEDMRWIRWDGTDYILGNRRNLGNFQNVQMHLLVLDDGLNLSSDTILPNFIQVEKNWQPISDMPGWCVYSYRPFQLVNVFAGHRKSVGTDAATEFRGSSQIVNYGDNRLGIVHIRNEAFEYLHYAVLFDANMSIVKISEPFSFFGANVEFAPHIDYNDDHLHILVNVHDQLLYEFNVPNKLLEDMLNRNLNANEPTQNAASVFYRHALSAGNVFAALGFATFTDDRPTLVDAIVRNHKKNYFRDNVQKELQPVLMRKYGK